MRPFFWSTNCLFSVLRSWCFQSRVYYIVASCMMLFLCIGCLYTYHDYDFSPDQAEASGFWINISARLFRQIGEPLNGAILDSASCFWDLEWLGDVDDSLRAVAHLECDSVSIWASDQKDTLQCNIRQNMAGWGWVGWICGRITYQQLHSRHITLRMIVFMVFNDGRETRKFEVLWSGKQKKTRIYSDY